MANKEFYSRIIHKHDIEENWNKATNFTPLAGEIIVYDKDDTHNYVRIKIGDGVTKINNLPFTLDKYAGSSTFGGSATSAVKLDTATAGSATQPVYFTGGKPVATTYTLGKSVPSDAKFTDTTYSAATTSTAGLMSAADKTKLDGLINGFKTGTAIPSNSDLNNYTTIGKYSANTEAIAKTLVNCPTKTNFVLYVIDRTTSGVLSQIIIALDGKMHVRSESSSGWRSWETYATLDDINTTLNRTTAVNVPDTNYSTYMARGTSLNSTETTPTVNGAIAWTYE